MLHVCPPPINGGLRNGGDATFVWQEREHTRTTQMTRMPSDGPSNCCISCVKCEKQGSLRHGRVICLPEGHVRHVDVTRQKLSPRCLATISDSQLPLNCLLKCLPTCLSSTRDASTSVAKFLMKEFPENFGDILCKPKISNRILPNFPPRIARKKTANFRRPYRGTSEKGIWQCSSGTRIVNSHCPF